VVLFGWDKHEDRRGFFVRTFDAAVAASLDLPEFVQDSQSRSHRGVIRGLHGRSGDGEAKLVRVARGAIFDVVVDARPGSDTFGRHEAFALDDQAMRSLYIPPGCLHGFQVMSEVADVCYRISRVHDPAEDVAVRFDDPTLKIAWPEPVTASSERDATAQPWSDLVDRLGRPRP